ncbi:hypothetical protein B566_EDAN008815, partial [Ephemera danica]
MKATFLLDVCPFVFNSGTVTLAAGSVSPVCVQSGADFFSAETAGLVCGEPHGFALTLKHANSLILRKINNNDGPKLPAGEQLPRVSTVGSFLMIALRLAILMTPRANVTVTTMGKPSGMAATAKLKHQCKFTTGNIFHRNKFSKWYDIECGVPHGSVLGPLLYSLYIYDIKNCFKNCQYHIYADDVQLYLSCKFNDVQRVVELINSDLQKLYSWSTEHGLKLNPTKSTAIVLSSKTLSTNDNNFCFRYVPRGSQQTHESEATIGNGGKMLATDAIALP